MKYIIETNNKPLFTFLLTIAKIFFATLSQEFDKSKHYFTTWAEDEKEQK